MRRDAVVVLLALASVSTLGNRAYCEGAIAEGIAPGGVAKGYGISVRVNQPDTAAARADALAGCKKGPERTVSGARPNDGQARARARCEIVSTFSNKCVALALDPKDGTPGAGWAVGDTQQKADEEALARCRTTAGTDRRDFCKVTSRFCDGSAK